MRLNSIKVSHVIWGYSGGGVDSVLDSYLEVDSIERSQIKSHVVIVNPEKHGLRKKPVNSIHLDVVTHNRGRYVSTALNIAKHIKASESQIVFLNGFNSSILGLILKPLLSSSTKLVSTYHGNYFARSGYEKIKALVFDYLELRFFKKKADAVLAVSKYSEEKLVARGVPRGKIQVLHNAISNNAPAKKWCDPKSTEILRLGSPITIITVSRLAPQKGIDVLINAAAPVLRDNSAVRLQIVGDGPMNQELRSLVENLGVKSSIDFLGNRNDVAELLVNADIFAMSSRQEDHSISILEAMRAALPIVVTDVGGNSESINHGQQGFLVDDLDVNDFRVQLESLVRSNDLRGAMGQASRARFEAEFVSNIMLQKFESFVMSVLRD